MSKEEVNVGGDGSDDYEVVPMGPVRKLERRLDSIEQKAQQGGSANQEMMRDVLDIMKSNQKIVNDMTESTHELKNSVEDLTHKMDSVVDNMNEFMNLLKDASEVDMEGEIVGDMQSRIADAIGDRMGEAMKDLQNSNQEIINSLDDLNKTMRRAQTAQKGSDRLVDRNQNSRSSGNQQNSRNQQSQAAGGQSSGSQRAQRSQGGQRGSGSRNYSDSERMKKLRNRLNGEDEQ